MRRIFVTMIVMVMCALSAGRAVAQPYTVQWSTGDNGGATTPSSGGVYTVAGTFGQADAGPQTQLKMTGGGYSVIGGFWGVAVRCPGDFNDDGFLTFEDFDAFVSAFEGGFIESDFNDDGFLTFEDFDAFVVAFELGC